MRTVKEKSNPVSAVCDNSCSQRPAYRIEVVSGISREVLQLIRDPTFSSVCNSQSLDTIKVCRIVQSDLRWTDESISLNDRLIGLLQASSSHGDSQQVRLRCRLADGIAVDLESL